MYPATNKHYADVPATYTTSHCRLSSSRYIVVLIFGILNRISIRSKSGKLRNRYLGISLSAIVIQLRRNAKEQQKEEEKRKKNGKLKHIMISALIKSTLW